MKNKPNNKEIEQRISKLEHIRCDEMLRTQRQEFKRVIKALIDLDKLSKAIDKL